MSESESLEGDIHWTPLLEKYFQGTGEKAHCLSWCHKESERQFSRYVAFIDLPVIILSIFNGAISMGSSSLFGNANESSIGIGIVALITAIMNAVNSYYGWTRRIEAHKNASFNYAELYQFLVVEMGLPREERVPPKKLLKMVHDDYNKLRKQSPLIPETIKKTFIGRFSDLKEKITFPEELNGLEEIIVYHESKDTERVTGSAFSVRLAQPSEEKSTESAESPSVPNSVLDLTQRIDPLASEQTH